MTDRNFRYDLDLGGTPLCYLNRDVRPDRVWFSGCFVLTGVCILSLFITSLPDLTAKQIVIANALKYSKKLVYSYFIIVLNRV